MGASNQCPVNITLRRTLGDYSQNLLPMGPHHPETGLSEVSCLASKGLTSLLRSQHDGKDRQRLQY